jgi:hypothetical protein
MKIDFHVETYYIREQAIEENIWRPKNEEVPSLWSSGQSSWLQIQRSTSSIPGAARFTEKPWVWSGVHTA